MGLGYPLKLERRLGFFGEGVAKVIHRRLTLKKLKDIYIFSVKQLRGRGIKL